MAEQEAVGVRDPSLLAARVPLVAPAFVVALVHVPCTFLNYLSPLVSVVHGFTIERLEPVPTQESS